MFFFPIWSSLPQFHSEWDAWHSLAQLPLEVLATVGQVRQVMSLGKDLALLNWVFMRYPPSA